MRAWWLPLLLVPLLAGCLTVFDDEADGRDVEPADRPEGMDTVRVSSVRTWSFDVDSFDNTTISTLVYEPLSPDAPGGHAPEWPVLVFLHGFGDTKETWQTIQFTPTSEPVDLLERFAEEGFLVVAYDARGFGGSGGQSTIAGPAELADLEAVIDFAIDRFSTDGQVGLTGFSYGAGQSLMGWARDDRVVTAVPLYGWSDLADGLVPGHVPKIGWMHFLATYGAASSGGDLHPMVAGWYEASYLRSQDAAAMRAAEGDLRARGIGDRITATDKPLFVCQGMQETLFPQVDRLVAGGFTRSYVHPGGHGAQDVGCWDRALDWFRFFLQGIDTEVDDWPVMETVDARDNERVVSYGASPRTATLSFGLRAPDLTDAAYSNETFTIEQRLIGNPLASPAGISDVLGVPPQDVPGQFTQDPQSVFFSSAPLDEAEVLLGAPTLTLHLADDAAPFQVAATLYIENADGARAPIVQGATAVLDAEDAPNGTVELRFPWTKADIAIGERLVLEVGANDPGFWLPLLADYSVDFTGDSGLEIPVFAP